MTLGANTNQTVVKLIKTEKTESGFMISEDSNKEIKRGEVISMAGEYYENGTLITPVYKVGDKVFFRTYSTPLSKIDSPSDQIYFLTNNEITSKIINE